MCLTLVVPVQVLNLVCLVLSLGGKGRDFVQRFRGVLGGDVKGFRGVLWEL